jgi:hypothetical protein
MSVFKHRYLFISRKLLYIFLCSICLPSCLLNPLIHELFFPVKKKADLRFLLSAGWNSPNTISGTITGLTQSGLVLSSGTSPSQTLSLELGKTTFQFPDPVSFGAEYNVTVSTQPIGLVCVVSSGSGMISASVNNVGIYCRTLNSQKYSYSGSDITLLNPCSGSDQATGIGPYTFEVNAPNDDVLFTINTNYQSGGSGGGSNFSEMRLYVDGEKQHTFGYDRYWGQPAPMTTAFVIPGMSLGSHTLELRFCGISTTGGTLQILGSYPTILTATSLTSIPYYEGRSSYLLPTGTTSLSNNSSTWVPIVNGSNMEVTYTAKSDVLLWQNLSLGGLQEPGVVLRIDPLTSEDWTMASDGPLPMSTFTYTSLSSNSSTTLTGHYNTGFLPSIIGKSKYDNSLNAIAFKIPNTKSYGKSLISALVQESTSTFTSLMNIPISNSSNTNYLISFATNYALNSAGGGCGCEFQLLVNGSQKALNLLTSSAGGLTFESSLISIENVPAGSSVPLEIRFRRFNACGTCEVYRATLTALPLD